MLQLEAWDLLRDAQRSPNLAPGYAHGRNGAARYPRDSEHIFMRVALDFNTRSSVCVIPALSKYRCSLERSSSASCISEAPSTISKMSETGSGRSNPPFRSCRNAPMRRTSSRVSMGLTRMMGRGNTRSMATVVKMTSKSAQSIPSAGKPRCSLRCATLEKYA